MIRMPIGKFIADERKRKGYTQKQLSEKLEISNKTISKWERGKSIRRGLSKKGGGKYGEFG